MLGHRCCVLRPRSRRALREALHTEPKTSDRLTVEPAGKRIELTLTLRDLL